MAEGGFIEGVDDTTLLLGGLLLLVAASRGGGTTQPPVAPIPVPDPMVWQEVTPGATISTSGYYRVPRLGSGQFNTFMCDIPDKAVAFVACVGVVKAQVPLALGTRWVKLEGDADPLNLGREEFVTNAVMTIFRDGPLFYYATSGVRTRFQAGGGLANVGSTTGGRPLGPSVNNGFSLGNGSTVPMHYLGPIGGTIDVCSLIFYGQNGGGTDIQADFKLYHVERGQVSINDICTVTIDQTGPDPRNFGYVDLNATPPLFTFQPNDLLCVQWTQGQIGPSSSGLLWRCEYSREGNSPSE